MNEIHMMTRLTSSQNNIQFIMITLALPLFITLSFFKYNFEVNIWTVA